METHINFGILNQIQRMAIILANSRILLIWNTGYSIIKVCLNVINNQENAQIKGTIARHDSTSLYTTILYWLTYLKLYVLCLTKSKTISKQKSA